jgi:F-type H+-transporting ATPase subunit b
MDYSHFLATSHLILAEGGSAPPLQFRVDLLIFSLIIFLLLLALLFRFAWKPIMEGLEAREQRIGSDIENARVANEKAQATLAQYESKLSAATDEAKNFLAEARRDAAAAKEKILAEARDEAARLRDRALADIESAKNAAVRELAERSVDSAVSLAGNIVGRSLKKDDHARLIEDSIQSFTGA